METFTELLDQPQVKEVEPSSIHSLSYMPPEYEIFKFHEEFDEKESLGQESTKSNTNIYEQVENEIHVGISTNVPILMEFQSTLYEVSNVQSNPTFEFLDQEDNPIKEDSFGNYTKNAEISEIAIALQHLHVDVEPPVLHHNVKSTNFLLVDDSHAKLPNFGLPKLGRREGRDAPTPVKGSYDIVGDDNKPQSHERF
ncbi:wall-associated receptor kinase-like 14 [Cryptomeria japonica]|uniref:wall-associated receptor kinase-like 14 n=1 Tax=Cryptomeria japonica TaxID=3369 RepID=UPI0027DAB157|nr:wall-associated receptor kinase-like 14 [Cryptomeria japonica]